MRTGFRLFGTLAIFASLPLFSQAQAPTVSIIEKDGKKYVQACSNCTTGASAIHSIFTSTPKGKTPKVLNQLGTSPQFGEIPEHTASSAYSHLSKVYSNNVKNGRKELDKLLTSIGYTGFKDPAFNESKITPEVLPTGTTGWMGAYAKGHSYVWSTLGKSFETYRIAAKSGSNYLYIMKKCGNAFYNAVDGDGKMTFKNDGNCIDTPVPGADCKTQTLTFEGKESIEGGDVKNSTQEIQILGVYTKNGILSTGESAGKYLCLGTVQVPVRLTYGLKMDGETSFSKTVEVCDKGAATANQETIKLPIKLGYNLTSQDVKLGGEDGKVYVTLTKKQYKKMRKIFGRCCKDGSAGCK